MTYLVIDLETSISNGPHGSQAKEPSNDFYTLIVGNNPIGVRVHHKEGGFKRTLPDNSLKDVDVIVGHNLTFDISYFVKDKQYQDFIKRGGTLWDTQYAEYLLTGQRHCFASLAELQKKYLGRKIKKDRISKLFKKGVGADKILQARHRCQRLFTLYEQYAQDDGVTTLQVFAKQYKKAKELHMLPVIQMYMKYLIVLIEISNSGIHVDLDNCQKTLRDFKLKSLELLTQASEIVSKYWTHPDLPEFSIQSPTHKSAILFGGGIKVKVRRHNGFYKDGREKLKFFEEPVHVQGMGVPRHLTTESKVEGKFQTGADVIEQIYKSDEVSEEVKEYCRLQKEAMNLEKMCSTYLEPFLNLSIDGVLYPNYNNAMTITGRLSSSKPNLQNVPSKGGMLDYIQGQFIAPEGFKCVSIDFSQLEIYVQAYLAQDDSLTNDLLSGIDFHCMRLSYAEDMSYEDVYKLCKVDKLPEWDYKRTLAKTISYQKAYGAAPKSLAKSTGIDEEIIKKIFEKEDMSYPNVKAFNDSVLVEIDKNQQLSTVAMLPLSKIGGGQWCASVELLPIFKSGDPTPEYRNDEMRHIGYYQSITGRRYSFEEVGRIDRNGTLHRGYSPTQTKNYFIQGTAGDVLAATSSALLPLLNKDVKMVNQIHDSIWFYIRDDENFDLTISRIVDIMQDIPKHFKEYLGTIVPFKFRVDAEVGTTFANTVPYDVKTKETKDG